jgi:inosine-uridine nucleoside N-ribohydrolase
LSSPRKLIIDTDISLGTPGAEIDDGAALLLLLNSPEVEVLGITTVHGNVPTALATTNALRMVAWSGYPRVPIFEGSKNPLIVDEGWLGFLRGWQSQYGSTPLWNGKPNPQPATNAIIDIVEAHPGEVSIAALGPFTNLALALLKAPNIAQMVKSVIAMGGSLSPVPQAEFNIRCDPEAAAMVFEAPWPVQLHGLEITRQCLFKPRDFEMLVDTKPGLRLLKDQAADWIQVVEAQGWESGGCSLHDAVAAAAIIRSDLFDYRYDHSVQVSLSFGPERGITLIHQQDSQGNLGIATRINVPSCKAFIQSRLGT